MYLRIIKKWLQATNEIMKCYEPDSDVRLGFYIAWNGEERYNEQRLVKCISEGNEW